MIDKFLKDHVLRWLINRYYGEGYTPIEECSVIHGIDQVYYYTLKSGVRLHATRASRRTPLEDPIEYDMTDLRATDTVLDLGANVGGFTVAAAQKAKDVLAIEPLFYDELIANVILNAMSRKIRSLKFALGNGDDILIEYDGVKSEVASETITFEEAVALCGGQVDFLKCDCEGAELTIPLELLKPIRRIEMEFHNPGNPKEEEMIHFLRSNWGFTSMTKLDENGHRMMHCFKTTDDLEG